MITEDLTLKSSAETEPRIEQWKRKLLRNLGWNYYRMWSIDWTFDRKRTEQRLLESLPKPCRFMLEDKNSEKL